MIGYTVSALQISANKRTAFLLAQALSQERLRRTELLRLRGEERELDYASRYISIIGISAEPHQRNKESVSCTRRAATAAE
jgi:hypothetical protein